MNSPNVHMVAPDQLPALPDDPGRQFGGAGMPMNGIPRFEVVPQKKADGTYDYVEYVDIMVAGDPRNMPRHKVTDGLRRKYQQHYDHWKQTQQMAPQGSPLEMWPILATSQVHTLKAANIFTVEQLAQVADSNLHSLPMGQTLREQARAWLKEKESADAIESRRREQDVMRDSMRLLEQQVQALSAELAKAKETPPAEAPVAVRQASATDLSPLRSEYEALAGKKPFGGWGEDILRERIAALRQEG